MPSVWPGASVKLTSDRAGARNGASDEAVTGVLWLSTTGFYLLFKSFKRRDFRWVLPSWRFHSEQRKVSTK